MISKERLEELIKQCATIYDPDTLWGSLGEIKLNKNFKIVNERLDGDFRDIQLKGGICKCFIPLKNLVETKEEAKWQLEFGCIERTENLKLLPYEEICDGSDYDFVFSTPNHCRVTMFIGGNEIFMYKGISSCWSWELTKENYTIACKKCKELFLGEKDDNT